jgi:hypothetical protein
MSTLTSYTSATRPAASSNTGLCIFRTDTNALEVSDGTSWQTYNSDGASSTFGSNSYSVDFDGSNDYIDISGAAGLFNSATAFSISLWYYADAYGGAVFGTGANTSNGVWILPYASGSNFFFSVRNGGTTGVTTTSPALNQWVHVAATFNAGNGALYLTPLGGSTTTTTSSSLTSSLSSTAGTDLSIGRLAAGFNFYFNGKVDEVAIWNRDITSAEVSNIINNKQYSGLSAMWRLENTADATIGGSGYNGTMNNFVSPQGFVSGAGNTPY